MVTGDCCEDGAELLSRSWLWLTGSEPTCSVSHFHRHDRYTIHIIRNIYYLHLLGAHLAGDAAIGGVWRHRVRLTFKLKC